LNEPVKFFEYDSKLKRKLKEKYRMRDRDFDRIKVLNKKQKCILMKVLEDRLKATSYVGILTVGKNTIQILPKISKYGGEQDIIRNLLFMLSYTRKLKIKETEISELCRKKENRFFEIFIYLFAKNLNETMKQNFYKNYSFFSDNLSFIRGKILFNENLRKNLARKHKVHCRFSEFTENILLNQIFRYTVFLLLRITGDPENYSLLKQLEFILSDVSLERIRVEDFSKVHLNRLSRYLEPLVQLSKLFITHGTIQLFHGKLETFSFVFDMEELFEEFVAEFIKRHKSQLLPSGTEVKSQDKTKKLVDSPEPLFTIKPDILINSKGKKLIIDTKYKMLNPEDRRYGVSQADMYQMLAYSVKHGCKQAVLLYPEHLKIKTPPTPYVIQFNESEVKVYIKAIPLDIDLLHEQHVLLDKLKPICALIHLS